MGNFKPLIQFLVALIAISVALVAASFNVLDKIFIIDPVTGDLSMSEFSGPVLSFMAWMAITIIVATLCAIILQFRICYQSKSIIQSTRQDQQAPIAIYGDYIITALPVIPGLIATLHIMKLGFGFGANLC